MSDTKTRRLSGAALDSHILRQALSEEHLGEYGLPLGEYDWRVEWDFDRITCEVIGTRRSNGVCVRLSEIWTGDSGEILQRGTNYGDLTL